MIPSPFVALVLGLAAFRVARLVGWDDFPPIASIRRRLVGERVRHSSTEARGPIYVYRRPLLNHFLACPYCQGFWVSVVVYGAWLLSERVTLYALAPFALSAFVGIVARQLDP